MKGSDKVNITIDIGGELIKLNVKFDEQNDVRDAEREVKLFIDQLRKSWHDISERKLFAMAAYRFAYLYHQLLNIQQEAIETASTKSRQIEEYLDNDKTEISDHTESIN